VDLSSQDKHLAVLQAKVRGDNGTQVDLSSQNKHLAVLQAKVRGGNQLWYLDSGCSRHMTGDISNFLSLTAFDGGSVVFGNGKSEKIIGVAKIVNHSLTLLIMCTWLMGYNIIY